MNISPIFSTKTFFNNKITNSNTPNKQNSVTKSLGYDSVSFRANHDTYAIPMTNYESVRWLNKIGVKAKVKLDQTVSIYKYVPNKKQIAKLGLLGIDEDSLFQHVSEIEGSVDLTNSKLKSLHKTRQIGGYLIAGKNLVDTGDLIGIGEDLDLRQSPIRTPKNIKYIGGNLFVDKGEVARAFTHICVEGVRKLC